MEHFIEKEYDGNVVWTNSNSLLSKGKSWASESITLHSTSNNTKVSAGCLKSSISTESATNKNTGPNDAISSGANERYQNSNNCLFSFLMDEIKFLRI